ncbi:equilibrative nucleoside transporter 1 [Oncorhynchus mykiss]|uniref:equilibrative nucleoside transporter 1 n=1 Tax=Oncorhynchus mykiss TaxID=8022 RepID=UPI0018788FF9|nr:equilibrative nucleoside transporter 1 [Oncorhynchus mykiss]
MDVHKPKDKNNGVWLIFFMLGLGTLLPWSFFMTATMYFTSRLRDPTQISTDKPYDRSPTEASYNNVSTLCAMVPLLIFTCLNSVLHHRIPQKFRIMGSLAVILVLFLITAIAVKIDMAAGPFFTLTMIKIVIINSFGAILQGSLFGMAGLLPAKYTTPIMSGQGLAGTFAAFSMICAIANGDGVNGDGVNGDGVNGDGEFYRYYNKRQSGNRLSDEVNRLDENAAATTPVLKQGEEQQTVSMLTIFKKIWVPALSVCFAFTVTIGVYPAVTVDVKSTVANGGAWEMYFIPVCCFLLFNLSDWAGRSLTAVCTWPGKDSKLVPIFMVARVIFVPLFMLCNVQPRYNLPVVFPHDAWFIVFMILFAFSSGYLASLCMCFGPKLVAPHEAETAGAIMAFFLSLGLALGASFSFLFRAIV